MNEPLHLRPPRLAGEVAPPEFEGALAREATRDDAPAILGVFEAAFDQWPPCDIDVAALEHLHWKMETADGETISPHDVVVADGKIAAAMLAWIGRGKLGDNVFVTDRAVDLAVHPDYQGRRFARLLMMPSTVRNEGRTSYFSWDTRPNAPPVLHMSDGTRFARGVRVWGRPLGPIRAIAGLRHPAGRHYLARQLSTLGRRDGAALRAAARDIEVRPLTAFDQRVDALWIEERTRFDIARRRNAAWLNWRYLDPRAGRILTIGAFEGDALLGYLAVRRAPRGADNRTAALLDVLSRGDRPAAVTALVRAAARAMRSDGATRLDAWLAPDHLYEAAFEAAGLADTGILTNVEFGTKRLGAAPDALAILRDPASTMHVTLGDFDWI
ncbi:MAG: hypothetical protein O3A10_06785 [Chloroflexi bacterium]|nr:hypothetical protein [Chloroflexota bacterium]